MCLFSIQRSVFVISISRELFVGDFLFHQEDSLLGDVALLQSRGGVGRLRAASVAHPEEYDGLSNKHTDGAGGKTSENAKDGRNKDEADNAEQSATNTIHVTVVWVRRLAMEAVSFLEFAKVRAGVARVAVSRVRLAVAAFSESEFGLQVHHVCLGGLDQSADAVEDQLSQALGVAVAHLP